VVRILILKVYCQFCFASCSMWTVTWPLMVSPGLIHVHAIMSMMLISSAVLS